ncbi:4-hydroxy-tetrahydrodipicolinate synthase [Robiginitalea biformata]|uniref:4-hydroxy-tetrahydrodipicolinate synthase n=1 Tax=Robiginitalea biformata (strain ATCC BAA-864 / DSM 15991 / KCTC 12146 / HTCC2501) TaxID=313596 RepID=A4CLV4_ROBBH|nr:4-hydroxy-tetrahydrodipicolinate synthase [Robiginitalea biformata]EAR15853.1 putative dihydrodipicolinate synthase [Robiginitalea biformata HTCC2501]
MRSELKGTGVALVTPFREDLSPDIPALRKLVRHVIEGGVDYLVALGTTAESATLAPGEKAAVLRVIAEENDGRLPLVAGIGGNNTLSVAAEMESANLDGYDAILSVSPYYSRPTQEGIYQHFKYLAHRAPLPIVMYNVPARTGSNMLPETVARLARDCQGIVGIKEACGDIAQIHTLIDAVPRDFLVISGDDLTAVPTVLAGGVGVISVLGQALPVEFSTMIRQGLAGESGPATDLSESLRPLIGLIFREGNPAGVKMLLSQLGICRPEVRLPLMAASAELSRDLDTFMTAFLREKV